MSYSRRVTVPKSGAGQFWSIVAVGANRPNSTNPVMWAGATQPTGGGTTSGGSPLAVNGLDYWQQQ